MKTITTKSAGKIVIDPTLDERYGKEPLFPHKIERIKNLLKDTTLDSAVTKAKKTA